MTRIDRRTLVKGTAAAGMLTASGATEWARAWAQASPFKPEPNAQISLLRWRRFVEAEDAQFNKMVAAFTQATGVKVQVASESFDDVQPKASVAANTGAGPDLFWGLYSLPHLFPQRCVDVSDVADYLGKKYGGWVPLAEAYGKLNGKWISIPVAVNGGYINYRISAVKAAGFNEVPGDNAGFLELCKALKAKGTPAGFPLGRATGDGNAFAHWLLWSHGAYQVDDKEKITINSPETMAALRYAKQLYETFIPGTAAWNDASNNRAYLAGEIALTANGISIYAAAKISPDAKQREIAADTDHAFWPVGPVGKPAEIQLAFPMLAMNYTRYPNACKAFMAFILEADQFNPWLEAANGYLTHMLNAYDSNPVWTTDPKTRVFREAAKRSLVAGARGPLNEKAATATADFIIVDLFANVCTGKETEASAIQIAERQLRRIYR
ncbi:ABC transporter substrate-binding protein [Phreatobacter sp. AB_2022a]|uniref:ABC transporter substrate-binding protein n=1 Tax=Phreatobacter sp. AB_2022a TaxID=3003134 RepID=UPI0005712D57|nr:ABC transporter substrate-binding protein [Phreatobacter sp. AB_2022a]MCZ0734713.1 ABC transporter substrate-binding protein [Phreatobacter sp. AB_2022a]CEJ10905.1 Bacterial extracellular solute-binding protein [bacterium YEK0313]